jgi:hypothetical protein
LSSDCYIGVNWLFNKTTNFLKFEKRKSSTMVKSAPIHASLLSKRRIASTPPRP